MLLAELTLIEAAWLVISLVGLVFAILNLAATYSDVTAARLIQNYRRETRLLLAAGAVHRNWVRVAVFAWWTLLGIGYGFFALPDPPRIAGLLGLIATAAGLAWTGVHEARERREIADLLTSDIAEDVQETHAVEVAEAEQVLDANETAAEVATARHDEMRTSMKATAVNTERIATNTEPKE